MTEKGPTVYMLDPRDTDISGVFGRALTKIMESQYVMNVTMGTSDEGNVPLLLLCHSYSRIGTDIETAASKLRGSDYKRVAVLVIHVKEPHALPSTNPTDNLFDVKYEAFGCLVDFAFSQSAGIYESKMNTAAAPKLNTFLTRFMDVTPRYADKRALPNQEESSNVDGNTTLGYLWNCLPNMPSGSKQPSDISAINGRLDRMQEQLDQLLRQQMVRPNTDPTKDAFIDGIRQAVYEIDPTLLEAMQKGINETVREFKDKDSELKRCQPQLKSQCDVQQEQQTTPMQLQPPPDKQQGTGLPNPQPTPMDATSDTIIDSSWEAPSLQDVPSPD